MSGITGRNSVGNLGGGAVADPSLLEFIKEFVVTGDYASSIEIAFAPALDFADYIEVILYLSLINDFHFYADDVNLSINDALNGYYNTMFSNKNGVVSGYQANNTTYGIIGQTDTTGRPQQGKVRIQKHANGDFYIFSEFAESTENLFYGVSYKAGQTTLSRVKIYLGAGDYWNSGSYIRAYGVRRE